MYELYDPSDRVAVAAPEMNFRPFEIDPAVMSASTVAPTRSALGLPSLSEFEVVRYFTRLTHDNYGVDVGPYPLGSCTMKYNPKLHDALAGLDGFRYLHPGQPAESMQGLLTILHELEGLLCTLTGMDGVSLAPAAGAHAELAGMFVVRKHFETKGQSRPVVLVADSAHGTNPSSAAMAGFDVKMIPTTNRGMMDMRALERALSPAVAALMLTNPSTYGLFEENIRQIGEMAHDHGALMYYDGANLNALMGICRPGDMGFDIVHVNTHKSLATPHGGGGPGSGPLGVKSFLTELLPVPRIERNPEGTFHLSAGNGASIGRIKCYLGHVEILLRAFQYIRAMGAEGLRRASEDAVLNANYLKFKLRDVCPSVFPEPSLHECLLYARERRLSVTEIAERIIEDGLHPPSIVGAGCVYFPNELKDALLFEPTETESRTELDNMAGKLRGILANVADPAR
ncbi:MULTISPECIES: aminomethyl-transferring glycine dehydrogenase subunit GcvPB [unclassified Bradyrhizobium]|uniref:aminomethyl-transferring glycine dehydrogenase subunit GcvPB n=1 Tax=unclassified Bradyrhizobium TaxID=2631580 RepID=UPI002916AD7C|nr:MULTISPECIES: aminomethyl-transferring glycine dehydrogenase subunit GcvPB [unclassified Bradyrhizobium]